jgi:invasion protein IalB
MNGAMKISVLTLTGLLVAFYAAQAAAQDANLIDNFGKWSAFAEPAKAKKKSLCYMASAPGKEEGDYKSRGDSYLLVTHRRKEKAFNVVSIRAGYSYREGSEVTVTIGGHAFQMFTDGGNAWAAEAKTDKALVAAMRAGSTMTVKGVSGRGTKTTDTYSLSGFTAAHNAISKACGVK